MTTGLVGCVTVVPGSQNSETQVVNSKTIVDQEDDSETVLIKSASGSLSKFSTEPAKIESLSIFVRNESQVAISSAKRVDVLVKGVFPDGCSELHELVSEIQDGVIAYELVTRRPKGQMCIQSVRPFRFQFPLNSMAPGSYKISVNDQYLAFVVSE